MSPDRNYESEEEDAAAREAAGIGGRLPDEGLDPADRPVSEAGGGESEGFELAEHDLVEHASHGDQQSAHAILHHQGRPEEADTAGDDLAADHERSAARDAEE